MRPTKRIDDRITTDDGYTFIVVDMTDTEYIVRSNLDGDDMAMSDGENGVDWGYVYIPFDEAH